MAGSEGTNSLQRNGSGEDSDTDYENENIRPRGLTGLQNLGNTCYLNSAVQSLSNCPPLTRYFLDCPTLIRPEKSPMLSRSYLKLITELWHKKRPSYVVPSGVVSGIKAVHPMFRGYTQQDAQEFLRCFMDQLHEELKTPMLYSNDESDEDNDNNDMGGEDGNNSARLQSDVSNSHSRTMLEQKPAGAEVLTRRPSFDSISSQSELDYETCESGLSSERSSNASRDNGFSGDESYSDTNDHDRLKPTQRSRKSSAMSAGSGNEDYQPALDSVANTKEMKETANLLEKETEMRRPRPKVVMEGGDSKEQGATPYTPAVGKDTEGQPVSLPSEVHPKSPLKQQTSSKARMAKNLRFDSIISQTFDGKILSSVRCLNCETVSTTKETFQDLSLPIPSKDHLHMLHSGYPSVSGVSPPKGGTCGEVHQGWLASMFSWMKSWFVGPTITLQDCLSAFFSADELKGDNMYSCEKCKKLRNGLKYSKVLELPEILSIHLKRFRHEFYSSKISTYISFPLEGLDMSPYIHKGCNNEVMLYDLVAIICHHGTAGGGHYTAYCLNYLNGQWYEFDDQYVTEVDVTQVQNCEAYVLFYKKSNKKIEATRQRVAELEVDETSIMKFCISKQWVSRFHTFAEPGPITNVDFLCKHGGVPPTKVDIIDDLVVEIHQSTWELLYSTFGGGPVCNHLYACKTCHSELEKLRQRQHAEKETFIQLNEEFQEEEHAASVYAISMAWFKEWEAFVREKKDTPPDAIENSRICIVRNGQPVLRTNSDYGHLSREMWLFLYRIYGGGPEVVIRQSTGASVKKGGTASPQQQPQAQPTLAALAAGASTQSGTATQTSSPSYQPPSPSASTTTSSSSSSPPPPANSSSAVSTHHKSLSSSSSSVLSSSDSSGANPLRKDDSDDADKSESAEKSSTSPPPADSTLSSASHANEESELPSSENVLSEKDSANLKSQQESSRDNEDSEKSSEKQTVPSSLSPKAENSEAKKGTNQAMSSETPAPEPESKSSKEAPSTDSTESPSPREARGSPSTQDGPQIHSFGRSTSKNAKLNDDSENKLTDSGISSASDSQSIDSRETKQEDTSTVTALSSDSKESVKSVQNEEKQDLSKSKAKSKKGKQMNVTRI